MDRSLTTTTEHPTRGPSDRSGPFLLGQFLAPTGRCHDPHSRVPQTQKTTTSSASTHMRGPERRPVDSTVLVTSGLRAASIPGTTAAQRDRTSLGSYAPHAFVQVRRPAADAHRPGPKPTSSGFSPFRRS
jgi:hypothetical protein